MNLALRVLGPQTERGLCVQLLALQVVCCGGAFGVRYLAAGYYK